MVSGPDPGRGIDRPEVGRLLHLEVENFKSYRGLHIIGPFNNFTAIIGPNGSGKSNLMDAISFVCGVKTAQLRGNLQELLFSNSASKLPEDHPKSGRVTLVFEFPDKSLERYERAIVTSSATSSTYVSKYRIGNNNVSLDEFTRSLLDLGVNTKARNFLVFQGDIEKVAQKSASQLTTFFELISGSDTCKEEYGELEEQLARAEEVSSSLRAKKVQLTQRKKAVKKAKDEAEKYIAARQDLESKKSMYFLWKLFHIKYDLDEAASIKAEHEGKLAAMREERSGHEQARSQADRSQAGIRKQKLSLNKELAKLNDDKAKSNPKMLKIRETMNRQNKERAAKDLMLNDKVTKQNEAAEKLEKLEANIVSTRKMLEKAESEMESASGEGIQLTPELQSEYQRLKVAAEAETYEDSVELRKKTGALTDDQDKLKSAAAGLTQMQKQQERLTLEIDQVEASVGILKKRTADRKALRAQLDQDVKDLQAQNRQAGTRRFQLRQQLDEADAKLLSARSDHQQSRREIKMTEVVKTLKREFQAHGRLFDLCKIPSKRHIMAVTVLLGRNMDAVVVDTQKQAQQCIQYLRNNRIDPITFIPLDNIQVKPIDERLRQLGGTAKLGIDLVQYDPAMQKAMMFAFENALVCDTLNEARELGYQANHKVCSLDGSLIARNGSMSGGTSKSMVDRARVWDQAAVAELQEEWEKLNSKLKDLPDEGQTARQEGRKKQESMDVATELNDLAVNLDATRSKLSQKRAELLNVERAIEEKDPLVKTLEASVAAQSTEVEKLEKAINKVKDRMFKKFSAKVGVRNVREYEDSIETSLKEKEGRLSKLSRHISEMSTEAESQKRTISDLGVKITQDEEQIEKLMKNIEDLKKAKAKHQESLGSVEEQIASTTAELQEIDAQLDEIRKNAKSARAVDEKYNRDEDNVKKAIQQHKNTIQAVVEHAKGIQHEIMLANVTLPTTSDDEGDSDDDDDTTPIEWPAELRRLKYESLSTKLKRTVDGGARDRKEQEMKTGIDEIEKELETSVPNLKAPEEYVEVVTEEEALQQETADQKAVENTSRTSFNNIREQRTNLFNSAFEHISSHIDAVYKALTRSKANTMGGNAYLRIDDDNEPFKGGVNFTAIPPNKRYRVISDLSGGEKTLSALALLMAIHSYSPSPFFVLDEIDAALDAGNLSRVAHYIRTRTRSGSDNPFQGIVISLKDVFYEKADALVGVTRDVKCNASAVYTFSLDDFGEPQD